MMLSFSVDRSANVYLMPIQQNDTREAPLAINCNTDFGDRRH